MYEIKKAQANAITLQQVAKSYGAVDVIPPLSVEMSAGEFVVIVGPSGCGKSTLLNMIAGLEHVSDGRILMGGREVQSISPQKRDLAMVFQNYALYPHMTVSENIGYALKIAHVPKPERELRIAAAARAVSLEDKLTLRPGQLSGGQKQRVAIARAIVREPSVLLFDEPLSNLDAQLRHSMRTELSRIHKLIGATSVYVTHDQVEAMTLADRILVLNKGRIEQYDTPEAVYRRPMTTFVASFIGMPPMNLLKASISGGGLVLDTVGAIALAEGEGPVTLGLRPEDIRITSQGIPVTVNYVEDLGDHYVIESVLPDHQPIKISGSLKYRPAQGEKLNVSFAVEALHIFDTITGKRRDIELTQSQEQ